MEVGSGAHVSLQSFGLVLAALTSLGSAALPRGTRLVFLSNIGFLNIRWNGRVLQKKKKELTAIYEEKYNS